MSIKSWFRNWLMNDETDYSNMAIASDSHGKDVESDRSIRFDVIPARGGLVITVRNYDPKTDQHTWINHVIHDDEDTPARIAEIVSISMLRM